jgi:hypothetical protein
LVPFPLPGKLFSAILRAGDGGVEVATGDRIHPGAD